MKCHQIVNRVIVPIAIVFLFSHSNANAAFTSKAGKEELTFVVQDGLTLRALVQKPSGDGPFPAVIFLHGSGGMRDDYADWCEYLSKHGFIGMAYARRAFPFGGGSPDRTIRYKDYLFKDVGDLNLVIEQLRKLSFIGNGPTFVIGSSEGGHISYLAASQIKGLKAVIGLNGVTDYLDWYEWAKSEYPKFPIARFRDAAKSVREIFGCAPESCEDRYHALSPIHQVDQISCPIMIVHGEKDPQVPVRQAHRFADSLRSSNKPYEIHVYPKEGHIQSFFSIPNFGSGPEASWLADQVWTRKSSKDLLGKITTFLKENLK
ncbi:MAG: alpha/beta fold hydrolase [Deltaproteobacteria bacterium]|nr:alpha/beta fold hydrolase [Deltaproteobacteria bacterium]